MKYLRQPARLAVLALLAVVVTISLTKPSSGGVGTISKADLSGSWQMTLYGQGGCGVGTTEVTFTLPTSGTTSAATSKSHSVGCGDQTTTGNTFTISSLASNGSGTAGLSCGSSCGFAFTIQVSPDRSTFTLVDITDANNFLQGVAVHQ